MQGSGYGIPCRGREDRAGRSFFEDENMSIWDYVFDSEARQRDDINMLKNQSESYSRRYRRQTADMEARIRQLEHEVGVLALLSRSFIALLHKKNLWDAAEFRDICRRIDLEDGKEDGEARVSS